MIASPPAAPGMPSADAIEAEIRPISYGGADLTECVERILSLIRPAFEAKERECQTVCDSYAAENQQLHERALSAEAKLAKAVEALDDAAENIEHWGSYASSYLQDKHGWKDDIASARSASAAARGEKS